MAFFTRQFTYTQDKPILAFPHDASFPKSAQILKDDVQPGANGKRSLPAGYFVARVLEGAPAVERFRPLPRIQASADILTSSPNIEADMPWVVKNGDELFVLEPYVSAQVTAGVAATSVTYESRVYSFTPPGGTAQDNAIAIADFFNSQIHLKDVFRFVANDDDVWIFSADAVSEIDLDLSAGEWAATGVVNLVLDNTAVGTVSFVDAANNDEVVLQANAATALPAGVNLTTRTVLEVYGLAIHSIDFTDFKENYDIALLDEGQVYLGALPYYDDGIKRALPEIKAQLKW